MNREATPPVRACRPGPSHSARTTLLILHCRPRRTWFALCLAGSLLAAAGAALAAPASDTLLPATTVGYVSAADPTDLEEKFNKTQIGQLAQDESMKALVEQLEDQINRKFGDIKERLGVTLDELRAAAGGELTSALIHRKNERAALAVTMNVTDHRQQLDAVLAKIDAHLLGEQAKKSTETVAGIELTIYVVPAKGDQAERTAVHFERDEIFVAVDNVAEARAIAERFAKPGAGALSGVKAYQETQSRCEKESKGLQPDVRWFVDPFNYDLASKSLDPPKDGERDRKDTMQILREQGFDAILGVGGYVNLAVDAEHDVIHRTAVYAPPVKPGAKEEYNLAMQIMQLPNGQNLQVEPWAPRMIAAYTTLNLDILNGYDHVHTLFDAFSGYDGAFETSMEGFEKDPFGPKVNIRKEVIQFLGQRVTMMTDYKLPITPDSERYLFAIDVKDPTALKLALERLMDKDPDAQRKDLNGIAYWEIVPEQEEVDLGGLEGGLGGAPRNESEEEERVLQRSAVCLHGSTLLVGSDVEFLKIAIAGVPPQESLSASYDFEAVMQSLRSHAPPVQSSWSFTRTDESVRPIYELLRAGKMPESNTFLGRLLNELLTSEEDESKGILRKQQVDGKTLPSFELARRYFGPAGRSIRSDDDGWFICGVVLSKAGQ